MKKGAENVAVAKTKIKKTVSSNTSTASKKRQGEEGVEVNAILGLGLSITYTGRAKENVMSDYKPSLYRYKIFRNITQVP